MHTHSGRLPLILWITPTTVGEKALVLTRAGTCAEDFEAFSGEIASACYARQTNVARHRRWAHLITVEIVRREAAPGLSLGLDRLYGQANWVPLRGRDLEEVPDTRSVTAASRWPPHDPHDLTRTHDPLRPARARESLRQPSRTTRVTFTHDKSTATISPPGAEQTRSS